MVPTACFKNSDNSRRVQLVCGSRKTAMTRNTLRSTAPELHDGFKVLKLTEAINVKNGPIYQKILVEKLPRKKQTP